ncbi:MAG: hypothetical protein ABSG68_07055 [Thermoguttaceae bacterium]
MTQHIRAVSLADYVAALHGSGQTSVRWENNVYWQAGEWGSVERRPFVCFDEPSVEEMRAVFRCTSALVAAYVRKPDQQHPQNAWLYICEDKDYSLAKLNAKRRENARRALREFSYAPLDSQTLLRHGAAAYSDSRARAGLSDVGKSVFLERFCDFLYNPAHHVIGAWREDRLCSFMYVVAVDDSAIIGVFSTTDSLRYKPNNGLLHLALEGLLAHGNFRSVCYGLSTIQDADNSEGVHDFKIKVGFEARPVHRAFVFRPCLAPFANRCSYRVLKGLECLLPRNRMVRKASGMLSAYLGRADWLRFPQPTPTSGGENEKVLAFPQTPQELQKKAA